MSKLRVTIVLPALDLPELLEENLPTLLEELERRGAGDEVIVVDDSGTGRLADFVEERFPSVRALRHAQNGGFSKALTTGIEAAANDLIFSMNTDVRVRPGFLDRLVEAHEPVDVGVVAPRVHLHGDENELESLTALEFTRGEVRFEQPNLSTTVEARVELDDEPRDIGFAVGGTMLFSRDLFRQLGGFDLLFEPFYWEDIDLSWRIWRSGLRVVLEPRAVVEHMHRGTIGKVASRDLIDCMLEKNRLLFSWKHLDRGAIPEHLAGLYRRSVDAWVRGSRKELLWLCYALEELDGAIEARSAQPPGDRTFQELAQRADPRRS